MDDQSIEQNKSIEAFVDKLIEEKGFVDLLPEVRDQLKKDILQRLDDFITARIIAALSDQDIVIFENMLKEGKPQEEIQQFTSTHIADFADFLTNVLLEFRGVYLGILTAPIGGSAPPPTPPAPVAEEKN